MQNTSKRLRFYFRDDNAMESTNDQKTNPWDIHDALTSPAKIVVDTKEHHQNLGEYDCESVVANTTSDITANNNNNNYTMELRMEDRIHQLVTCDERRDSNMCLLTHEKINPKTHVPHTEQALLSNSEVEVDSRDSYPSRNPMHVSSSCSISQESRQPVVSTIGNRSKSIWKPVRGLTLSAFRRPENTIRLTPADPCRRFEDIYDMHGVGRSGVLGHGAFATVRLAFRKSDGLKVAVKSIAKHEALRSRRLRHSDSKHYMEEWEILRRLHDHTNVITLFDIFETNEEIILVTEYCPGGELFGVIQKRQRTRRFGSMSNSSEVQGAQITGQILRALAALHSEGIVHRDVKPENILLMKPIEEGSPVHVKLCDFGVARPLDHHGRNGSSSGSSVCVSTDGESSPLTPINRSRSFSIGSDYYAAPELMYSSTYDTAVDIYSLGVTLYIFLCGFPPVFSSTAAVSRGSDNEDDSDNDSLVEEVVFPETYWKDISEGAKNLLRKMLHRDASLRISAKEALRDPWLRNCMSSSRQVRSSVSLHQPIVDLAMVRNQLFESLAHLQQRGDSSSPVRQRKRVHCSVSTKEQSVKTPPTKRPRSSKTNSSPRRRRMERRSSTTALMALADLYRGVAAPLAAAAVAAAESDAPEVFVPSQSPPLCDVDCDASASFDVGSPVPTLSF